MLRFRHCILLALTICSLLTAADAGAEGPTMISPFYFGPNAFPVPEIVDRTSSVLRIDAEANYFYGWRHDHTTDLTLRAAIPLWTPRVNLSIWLPVMEWYRLSDDYLRACNVPPPYTDKMRKGHLTGDVYITTDIAILTEGKYRPDVVIRAGLKTASGGRSGMARYYDSPGYFFDIAGGKTLITRPDIGFSFRTALQCGFLCWQTKVNQQNDAVMFGIKLKADVKRFSLTQTFGGYTGWEHMSVEGKKLAHDTPVVSRTRLSYRISDSWSVYGAYERGIYDYPYDHVTVGVSWSMDILNRHKATTQQTNQQTTH